MRIRLVGLVVTGMFTVGCGSSTAPHNGGGNSGPFSLIGANQTDTIESTLAQALVVTVRGPSGQSSAGHVVQFVSVLDSAGSYRAYVETLTSPQPLTFVSDSLDANGRASAGIAFGTKAGTALVLVKVPDFGYVDSVKFTVTAGTTAGIMMTPLDTSVVEGHAVTLHASTVDHFGNPTSQSVNLAVTGPGTISGQTVTATDIGQITVVATSGTFAADTTHISSVPTGMLAASLTEGFVVANFDGTGSTKFAQSTTVGNLKWAPNGKSVVFDQNAEGCSGNTNSILSSDLRGTLTTLNTGAQTEMYPSYSRDGMWIYFTVNDGYQASLWRVHPDGTNADSLNSLNPSFDLYPAPSPDGSQIVYATITGASTDLRILTLSTGAVTDLQISGWAPSWAPAGNRIAYLQ
ncbi:MAG TPA: hypothetical protein VFA43_25455, partial [Gemmatimonadaceae bacterium]|nr:hypothetical protein [Gemmatimonadaceae bacterium]